MSFMIQHIKLVSFLLLAVGFLMVSSGKQFQKMTSARIFSTRSSELSRVNDSLACAVYCSIEPDCDGYYVTGHLCNRITNITGVQNSSSIEIFVDIKAYQMVTTQAMRLKLVCPERQVSAVVSQKECVKLAQADMEANALGYDATSSTCYVQKCTGGGFNATHQMSDFTTMFNVNFYPRDPYERILVTDYYQRISDCYQTAGLGISLEECKNMIVATDNNTANFKIGYKCFTRTCPWYDLAIKEWSGAQYQILYQIPEF